ncbi:MAG: hypothetical protein ABSF03_06095 [Streptosporangiaceae bacterium]|jgi:hypothetical protein
MTKSPAAQRRYWAGDLAATVTAPGQGQVAGYLSAYLAGPVGTHDLPRYQVSLHAGREELARASARTAGVPVTLVEPVPGVVLAASTGADGSRVFTVAADRLENAPGSWAASISGDRVDLHVADPARGPRHLLRIIRELMLRAYEDAGAVVLHAAGVEVDAGTMMICGPRGAGKTTAAAALLHQFGPRARLLSNDRLLACDGHQVVAVPLPVPVARGTLGAFPALGAAVPAARRARPGEPAPAVLPREFGTAGKIAFPARDFAAAFGAGLAASSQVTAIIIPSLADTADPPVIRRASPPEAQAALAACCFTPADEFWRPWLVARARPDADLAVHAARRCRQLAASVPCVTVSSGVRGPLGGFAEALATVTGAAR